SRSRAGQRPSREQENSTSCSNPAGLALAAIFPPLFLRAQENPSPFPPFDGCKPTQAPVTLLLRTPLRRYKRRILMASDVIVTTESTSLSSRSVLVVFCLAAGFAYRIIVGLFPPSIVQASVLLGLAALLLTLAVLARRRQNLRKYWEI